jgi:hypothetical protein
MKSASKAKNYALIAGTTLLLTLSFAGTSFASSGTQSFIWVAGSSSPSLSDSDCAALGLPSGCSLCDIATCPDVAVASNGDQVTIIGSGTLTIGPNSKSATGSGTFDDTGSMDIIGSGTWTATSLVSFVSYGSASAQGLPSDLAGGKAVIRVSLTTGGTALLTVACLLGTPPSGGAHGPMEGSLLNVQNVINFNKVFSGNTIYIATG